MSTTIISLQQRQQQQLDAVLQRIDKQSSSSLCRQPPSNSSSVGGDALGLGRKLAECFVGMDVHDDDDDESNNKDDTKILQTLCRPNVNPAIIHAFFEYIAAFEEGSQTTSTTTTTTSLLSCQRLSRWILRCEEELLVNNDNRQQRDDHDTTTTTTIATCVTRAFARRLYQSTTTSSSHEEPFQNDSAVVLLSTLSKLQTAQFRMSLLRECVDCAFHHHHQQQSCDASIVVIRMLSPCMAAGVLSTTSSNNDDERLLFLQSLYGHCWKFVRNHQTATSTSSSSVRILHWLAKSLHLFQQTMTRSSSSMDGNEKRRKVVIRREMGRQWCLELVGMMECVSSGQPNSNNDDSDDEESFGSLVSFALESVLLSCYDNDVAILQLFVRILRNINSSTTTTSRRRVLFDVAVHAMTTVNPEQTRLLLDMLGILTEDSQDAFVRGILYSLSCIFPGKVVNVPSADDGSSILLLETTALSEPKSLVDLFQTDSDVGRVLEVMGHSLEHLKSPLELTPSHQNQALLIGTALLFASPAKKEAVQRFLQLLTRQFPHLGISLMPVLLQSIQKAADWNGVVVRQELEFLCDTVVHDPSCAQEVWNLVGVQMTSKDQAVATRTTAIRLFPTLCARNKRLYRRIIDTLGAFVEHKDSQLRLAVAVTIHDLAKEDRIRDVSDVIGWLQVFLNDEDDAVIHFSLLSLHWLVVAQELDFALVVKVLNKRLRPINDIQELLKLPLIVLEALVILLGDGECDLDGSDEEGQDSSRVATTVSPQTAAAVRALVELAQPQVFPPDTPEDSLQRLQMNICIALGRYSLEALGVDEDGLRTCVDRMSDVDEEDLPPVTEASRRYDALRNIISRGLVTKSCHEAVGKLATRLVSFEEEVLGSSLWSKNKSAKSAPTRKKKRKGPSSATVAALPDAAALSRIHNDDPSSTSALALLLCIDASSTGDLFELAADLAGDALEPTMLPFLLQAWLNSMRQTWSGAVSSNNVQTSVDSVIEEIKSWNEALDGADQTYLALATFCLFVPDTCVGRGGSSIDFSKTVKDVQEEVVEASLQNRFLNREIGFICASLAAIRAMHSGDNAWVEEIVRNIETSVVDPGSQPSIGAIYGLSLFVNSTAAQMRSLPGHDDGIAWIRGILSLLVSQLTDCFIDNAQVITTLSACLKTGSVLPDLADSLSTINEVGLDDLSESTRSTAKSVLLGLSVTANALTLINRGLQSCVYILVQKLPWGIGKGLALASIFFACKASGTLHEKDEVYVLEAVRRTLSETTDNEAVKDATLALISLRAQGHMSTDIVESDKSTLIAAFSMASFPCLGSGASLFCSGPTMYAHVTKDFVSEFTGALAKDTTSPVTSTRTLATVLLGYFAFLKQASKLKNAHCIRSVMETLREGTGDEEQNVEGSSKHLTFSSLPAPKYGTVLFDVFGVAKSFVESARKENKSDESTSKLRCVLQCFEPLSLPGYYAQGLIAPLIQQDASKNDEEAGVLLLCSQYKGRRRAAFDGQEFLKLASQLARQLTSPRSLTSGSKLAFVSSLADLIPKITSDLISVVLSKVWASCVADIANTHDASSALAYLDAIEKLLQSALGDSKSRGVIPPRTVTILIEFVSDEMLTSLSDGNKFESSSDWAPLMLVVEKFVCCLRLIPLKALDDHDFFSLDEAADESFFLRSICVVQLCRQQCLPPDRALRLVLHFVPWLIRQTSPSNKRSISKSGLGYLMISLVAAAEAQLSGKRKDILMLLLEALHLEGLDILSLELVSLLVCVFANSCRADVELSSPLLCGLVDSGCVSMPGSVDISCLSLRDLPVNTEICCHDARITSLVANRLLRIHKKASVDQINTPYMLELIESTMIRCRSGEATEEEVVSLMSKLLLGEN